MGISATAPWFKFYGDMPKTLNYPQKTIYQIVQQTAKDHPNLVADFAENPEPTSPFGTKALGEPPACSGAPAIRNAVLDAVGVAIDQIPINPHVLYEEFSKAGLIHDPWREEA